VKIPVKLILWSHLTTVCIIPWRDRKWKIFLIWYGRCYWPWLVATGDSLRVAITFRIATLTYRCLNGSTPPYLTRLIIPLENSRSLRSSSSALLCFPRTRHVNLGDRSFAKVAPAIWNRLPLSVRNATTLPKFRSLLFKHLFDWCVLCFFCDSYPDCTFRVIRTLFG
jgi:hypothetical protein